MIKVLCLDDDNHSNSYAMIDKVYYDLSYFVKGEGLLKPNCNEYEIRQICLVDPPKALAEMSEDGFMKLFDLATTHPKYLDEQQKEHRAQVFNFLWDNAEEWCRV